MSLVDAVPDPPALSYRKWASQKLIPQSPQLQAILSSHDLLSTIKVNESVRSSEQVKRLTNINMNRSEVFNNDLSGGYNHKAGKFYADFSFSSKPPPSRVYVPQYNK